MGGVRAIPERLEFFGGRNMMFMLMDSLSLP